MNIRRFSLFAGAVLFGAATFGFLYLPKAFAAPPPPPPCNPNGSATMCYNGKNVYSIPPSLQVSLRQEGGTCGACPTTGT